MNSIYQRNSRGNWVHTIRCEKCLDSLLGWLDYSSAVSHALSVGWGELNSITYCDKCLVEQKWWAAHTKRLHRIQVIIGIVAVVGTAIIAWLLSRP